MGDCIGAVAAAAVDEEVEEQVEVTPASLLNTEVVEEEAVITVEGERGIIIGEEDAALMWRTSAG